MVDVRPAGKLRGSIGQLLRYAAVGIAVNLAGYLVYLLVTHLGVPPKVAMSSLYGVGVAAGFWGNSRLTFAYQGNMAWAAARYFLAHSIGYLINLGLLMVLVDHLGYAHQLVQAGAIFVVAGYLFLAFKLFVFAGLPVPKQELP